MSRIAERYACGWCQRNKVPQCVKESASVPLKRNKVPFEAVDHAVLRRATE